MNPDEIPLPIALPLIALAWGAWIAVSIADARERVARMLKDVRRDKER